MQTRMLFFLVALGVVALSWVGFPESKKPSRKLVLPRAELKLTPAALAFNTKGELYVAYRDKGSDKKSSSLWFRVFDPASGKELRSVRLQTPEVRLPTGANQLLLSPDSSLVLYSEFHGSILVTVLDGATLQKVSDATALPDGADGQFPEAISIGSNDRSVLLIAAEKTNRLNGTDARLIRLDTHDLSRVLSDVTFTNPVPEGGFAIGPNGEARIVRANMLYGYDPSTAKATLELSIQNQDDIRNVLFLEDGSLLLWSNQNEFGYVYRWKGSSAPDQSQRIEKCGVVKVFVSPDQLYGAALCEHQELTERNFGAITSRTAVVFDAKTLKIISEVPIERDLYPELAIWHGDGKIILATTQAFSNKLVIYELAEPKSGGKSATVDPKDGSVHLQIPVVVATKPKQ